MDDYMFKIVTFANYICKKHIWQKKYVMTQALF
jgi:hypothetical protein